MSRKDGRLRALSAERRLAAAASLGEALVELRVQQAMGGAQYGTDVGAMLAAIASALDDLGFEVEATTGGFGKPPTLEVK